MIREENYVNVVIRDHILQFCKKQNPWKYCFRRQKGLKCQKSLNMNPKPTYMSIIIISQYVRNRGLGSFMTITLAFLTVFVNWFLNCLHRLWLSVVGLPKKFLYSLSFFLLIIFRWCTGRIWLVLLAGAYVGFEAFFGLCHRRFGALCFGQELRIAKTYVFFDHVHFNSAYIISAKLVNGSWVFDVK